MDVSCQLLQRFCFVDDDPCGARVLVVAAHPDDETAGMAARLSHLRDVWVLHVSDGAPKDPALRPGFPGSLEEYRAKRRHEAEFALGLAGIEKDRIRCLGFPDQELLYNLGAIIGELSCELSRLRPEAIVTHPYEGGHPDHDAVAFCVREALTQLHLSPEPPLIEMTSYHLGPGGRLLAGEFLPAVDSRRCEPVRRTLDDEEAGLKKQMFDAFSSQKSVLDLLYSDVEMFRLAPCYDFTRPPHDGTVFYETLGWPATAAEFCRLAREASQRS
ncbi:MAG: PIG-L family deacetylase [Acidobacteria bacterium]|nr:PIG-L family deacetylase [Acidobacteriota bacterium]